jgi:hypothetical protein
MLNSADTSVSDVSTSFKRLQAERLSADAVLRELSPLQTMQDIDGLRDYLQNLGLKTEVHIRLPCNVYSDVLFMDRFLKMRSNV